MYDFDWQDNGDGRQYAECDDPRLVLVIERDESDLAPDGDGYAPAYWSDSTGRRGSERAGSTYDQDPGDVVASYFGARGYFGDADKASRYLRIFHDSDVREVRSYVHRGAEAVTLFDTPAFRHHCGIPDTYTTDMVLAGDVETWQAYLDGEVFAIGYGVNVGRTSDTLPVDLDAFTVEIESYGYYGETYAREMANEYCPRDIPELRQPLLDIL